MHGIVVITTPGAAKRDFVNALHRATGAVDLVVVQKAPPKPLGRRLLGFMRKVGPFGLPMESLHLLALAGSKRLKAAMTTFKERTAPTDAVSGYLSPVLETASVNSDEVLERLRAASPKVLVIWGGSIVKPKILKTAARAVNMHFGWCPWYRGADGNQNAVLEGRLDRLAITVHEAIPDVDAGRVLALVKADATKFDDPRALFRDLNDRAAATYLDVVTRLHRGDDVPGEPQDLTQGRNYRLKDWTYRKHHRLAETMARWERGERPRA